MFRFGVAIFGFLLYYRNVGVFCGCDLRCPGRVGLREAEFGSQLVRDLFQRLALRLRHTKCVEEYRRL